MCPSEIYSLASTFFLYVPFRFLVVCLYRPLLCLSLRFKLFHFFQKLALAMQWLFHFFQKLTAAWRILVRSVRWCPLDRLSCVSKYKVVSVFLQISFAEIASSGTISVANNELHLWSHSYTTDQGPKPLGGFILQQPWSPQKVFSPGKSFSPAQLLLDS